VPHRQAGVIGPIGSPYASPPPHLKYPPTYPAAMSKSNVSNDKDLFSFFPKKKSSNPPSAPPSGTASASAASSSSSLSLPSSTLAKHRGILSSITIGTKLAVYWPDDDEYYPCITRVHRKLLGNDPGHTYELHYDDGAIETIDLSRERFRIIGGKTRREDEDDNEDDEDDIDDDDEDDDEDEEDDVDDAEDDHGGSDYKVAGNDSATDDGLDDALSKKDDWSEEEDGPTKKMKRGETVVARGGAKDGGGRERFVSPTPMKSSRGKVASVATTKKKAGVNYIDFSCFLPQSHRVMSRSIVATAAPSSARAVKITQSQTSPVPTGNDKGRDGKSSSSKTQIAGTVPKPILGAFNQGGSHMHNHLKFFTNGRKDAIGIPADHPDHSIRSLYVDYNELEEYPETGKATAAQRQWWGIKSTVLLFKQGKFYEMFHDDADVGVSVLSLTYMRGTSARASFPESAYGKMVSRLVQAGYKVTRVEQTETPDALQERKRRMAKGVKKPEVVCREVCAVVSKSTWAFCYLDDVRLLESGEACTGPLVVIKETLVEDVPVSRDGMEVDREDASRGGGTKAICEYGVTIVDAVTGVVTLGQFADDVLRSRMQTLLARFSPSEVSEKDEGATHSLVILVLRRPQKFIPLP
jgi:DNA mismatch repair protein MSH6